MIEKVSARSPHAKEGKPTYVLPGLPQHLLENYQEHFQRALEMFCITYSPCQFRDRDGINRCVNSAASHRKGHQNAKGRIFGSGPYMSDFTYENFYETWLETLRKDVEQAQQALMDCRHQADQDPTNEKRVLRLHSSEMAKFYGEFGPARDLRSHTACFSCLMEMPKHVLPCSHVLCTSCIKGYGKREDGFDYVMSSCPLHADQHPWSSPFVVKFKPDFAGVRLLSLDG
jgi:hypothetical protein